MKKRGGRTVEERTLRREVFALVRCDFLSLDDLDYKP